MATLLVLLNVITKIVVSITKEIKRKKNLADDNRTVIITIFHDIKIFPNNNFNCVIIKVFLRKLKQIRQTNLLISIKFTPKKKILSHKRNCIKFGTFNRMFLRKIILNNGKLRHR